MYKNVINVILSSQKLLVSEFRSKIKVISYSLPFFGTLFFIFSTEPFKSAFFYNAVNSNFITLMGVLTGILFLTTGTASFMEGLKLVKAQDVFDEIEEKISQKLKNTNSLIPINILIKSYTTLTANAISAIKSLGICIILSGISFLFATILTVLYFKVVLDYPNIFNEIVKSETIWVLGLLTILVISFIYTARSTIKQEITKNVYNFDNIDVISDINSFFELAKTSQESLINTINKTALFFSKQSKINGLIISAIGIYYCFLSNNYLLNLLGTFFIIMGTMSTLTSKAIINSIKGFEITLSKNHPNTVQAIIDRQQTLYEFFINFYKEDAKNYNIIGILLIINSFILIGISTIKVTIFGLFPALFSVLYGVILLMSGKKQKTSSIKFSDRLTILKRDINVINIK